MIFLGEIALFHLLVLCVTRPLKIAKHSFLFCPGFAALREILFASAAHLLGDRWLSASYKGKIDWLLNGVLGIDFLFSFCSVFYLPIKPFFLHVTVI